jgi:hypothetical protein
VVPQLRDFHEIVAFSRNGDAPKPIRWIGDMNIHLLSISGWNINSGQGKIVSLTA